MTESVLAQAVSDAADALHDAWRRDYRAANGNVPRWKPLNDQSVAWLGEHSGTPDAALRVNPETGKKEIDIAALSNRQLPPQYSGENTAAARGAIEAIRANPQSDPEHVASTVHDQWLSRNGSWAPESQKVPYPSLPEAEKEEDRVVVREAAGSLERHFPQGVPPTPTAPSAAAPVENRALPRPPPIEKPAAGPAEKEGGGRGAATKTGRVASVGRLVAPVIRLAGLDS